LKGENHTVAASVKRRTVTALHKGNCVTFLVYPSIGLFEVLKSGNAFVYIGLVGI
jgi:hypothetical protein